MGTSRIRYREYQKHLNHQFDAVKDSLRIQAAFHQFLEISKDIEVVISEEKIAEDCKWDGLKGYITNTDLDAERVIAEYHGLWVVERAFRVSKGTLEMRPIAAKTITTIRVRLPENGTYATKTLFLTEKHLAVKPLFDLSDN